MVDNPYTFKPLNEQQAAAYHAWQTLEYHKPQNFPYYLSLIKKGLPTEKFHQFVSEIQQSNGIKNKGAVFTWKAQVWIEEKCSGKEI